MYLALITGFFGGLHCVGMCSPLLISLPFKSWKSISIYHVGRILSYVLWGGFLGLFGQIFFIGGFQQWLSIALGVLLLWIVIFPNTFHFLKIFWGKYLIQSRQFLLPKSKKNVYLHWFILGMFNGLLPCGLVYVASIGATVMGTFWEGALYMAIFGVGTLPFTLLVSFHANWFPKTLKNKLQHKIHYIIPTLILATGILLILRGLNLGIPYISPLIKNGTVYCSSCA